MSTLLGGSGVLPRATWAIIWTLILGLIGCAIYVLISEPFFDPYFEGRH